MPAVGGDVTHIRTSVQSLLQLESIETANFDTGDEAVLRTNLDRYVLDKASLAPRDGATVLYTRNALRGSDPSATPGRWILDAGTAGATGATGPAGPTGPTGADGVALNVNDEAILGVDTTLVGDAPSVSLLSVTITTFATLEQVLVMFDFSGTSNNENAGPSTFSAHFRVDGVDFDPGTSELSDTNGALVSGALHRTFNLAPGTHIIEVMADASDGDFAILAGANPSQHHAVLTAIDLGVFVP